VTITSWHACQTFLLWYFDRSMDTDISCRFPSVELALNTLYLFSFLNILWLNHSVNHLFFQGWITISSRSDCTESQTRQICSAGWCWSCNLSCCIVDYFYAEILELAGNAARDNKKTRIVRRHITLAEKNDEEINKFLGHVMIASGGVLPNIHAGLLPK